MVRHYYSTVIPTLPNTLPSVHYFIAPLELPRRPAILVLLGQLIPLGRPYRTQPTELHKMLIARKRVRALPSGHLASRYLLIPHHVILNKMSSIGHTAAIFLQGHLAECRSPASQCITSDVDTSDTKDAAAREVDVGVEVGIGSDGEHEANEEAE
ncbi:hypothetical protein Tco_0273877 [Tanacetum coccineum]